MAEARTAVHSIDRGCPAAPYWVKFWADLTLPLAGEDLEIAKTTLAVWDDPQSEQGDAGDCPHCIEQANRLRSLIRQAS